MSYCPKCGRRIYKEEKGCEFCGIVNDSSLWEGVGGIKNQTSSLDYGFEEKEEKMPKEMPSKTMEIKQEEMKRQEIQMKTETLEEEKEGKGLSFLQKMIIISMAFSIPPVGALLGIGAGLILWKSPFEEYHKFAKIMLVVSMILLLSGLIGMDVPIGNKIPFFGF